MPLLVLRITGSAAQMGVVVGLSLTFQLIGGVLAGPVVDKVNRRRLLIACDCAQLLLAGSVPVVWWLAPTAFWERSGIWFIYVIVALSSLAVSVSLVGLRAIMPQIVGRGALMTANGRMITAGEIAYGVGPAVAGVMVASFGEPAAIGVNALTFGVSALAWILIRPRFIRRTPVGDTRAPEQSPADTVPLNARLAGLQFVWRHPVLRSLVLLELVNALLVAGTTVLFIYYVRTDLGSGSAEVGLLLSLASVGAVVAAVLTTRVRAWLGIGRAWLLGVTVQGVALVAVSLSGSVWSTAVLAVVFAFGQVLSAILATSFRQEQTPDALLGRVSAAVLTVVLAAEVVGGVLSTAAADLVPTRAVFVAIGVVNLLLVVVGMWTPLRNREREPHGKTS